MKAATMGLGLLALVCGNAFALDTGYLDNEKAFRVAAGKRAARIAEGVYEVHNRSGSVSRFSFGEAGRAYEIALLRARLEDLGPGSKIAIPGSAKLVNGLTAMLGQLTAAQLKPARANCGTRYTLEATVAPGFASGSARAKAEFRGPPSPYANELHTFAFAGSDAGAMESSDTQWFSGSYGVADDVVAVTGPSFDQFLEAYAYVNVIGCEDGFRSVSDYFDPY